MEEARIARACGACRARKRKCDGKIPCSSCVAKQQECSFLEKKKRGPKSRALDVSLPSQTEIKMGELAEALTYLDTCWDHLHGIHTITTMPKVKYPVTDAQKVQAYAAFALTARFCGNKRKSILYMDQARTWAGKIYDSADSDSVAGLLLMSHYSMLSFDVPRASLYSTLAASLCKMIPKKKQDYKLFVISQLTSVGADKHATLEDKSERFEKITEFMHQVNKSDYLLPVVALLAELNKTISLLMDHNIFYSSPTSVTNIFHALDHVTVSEETRERTFKLMDNIVVCTENSDYAKHNTYVKKIFTPTLTALVNWKSGHPVEAMEASLACFSALQHMDQSCLYAILSNFTQIYMLGSLVRIFLEQDQFFLAQQMSEQIKKICALLSPDLDNICAQIDQLFVSYPSQNRTGASMQSDAAHSSSSQKGNLESTESDSIAKNLFNTSQNSNIEPIQLQSDPNHPVNIQSTLNSTSTPTIIQSFYNTPTSQSGNLEATHISTSFQPSSYNFASQNSDLEPTPNLSTYYSHLPNYSPPLPASLSYSFSTNNPLHPLPLTSYTPFTTSPASPTSSFYALPPSNSAPSLSSSLLNDFSVPPEPPQSAFLQNTPEWNEEVLFDDSTIEKMLDLSGSLPNPPSPSLP